MKRKVIKQGNGTLTITLPKQWTKEVGLNSEDEIDIETKDTNLIVHSGAKHSKPLSLNLKEISMNNCRSYISNAYKLGYDEVEVVFEKSKDIVAIQGIVDRLMGFEIISNTKNYCKINAISMISKEEFNNMFRKSYQLNSVCFDLMIDDMKKNKFEHLDTIKKYHQKTISFTDYCRRLINKYGVIDEKADKSLYII